MIKIFIYVFQRFEISNLEEVNTFILQGGIQLIKKWQ